MEQKSRVIDARGQIMEEDSRELDARYYMPAFGRTMKIVRGAGSRVWDDEGRE